MASPRQSALADRHRALGSDLGDWNGMDVPWSYKQDPNLEHQAVRNAAGLFDVSGLKKVHITGPDALAVANHVCTRDMTKIPPGRSAYAVILNEEGRITDDCIMFHIAPNDLMMVHGGGTGMARLEESAKGKDVVLKFDDDLHDISLQGPKAVGFLDQHSPADMRSLRYFNQVSTTLFDRPCMISRTGYSGERGYEIFAGAEHIGPIWDAILEQGKSEGIIPCSFNCIDMIRVEAALLFYPYDMTEENSPWEVGLGFAVAKKKQADFRGKKAVMDLIGKDKINTFGIVVEGDEAVPADAEVLHGNEVVGKVTAPLYSTVMKQSMAMVQLRPDLAREGVELSVRGADKTYTAKTHTLPFYDPTKAKRTAVG